MTTELTGISGQLPTPPAGLPGWPAMLNVDLAALYLSISRSTIYELVASGQMPEAEPLSLDRTGRPTRVAWRRDTLDRWISQGRPTVDEMSPAPGTPGSGGASRSGGGGRRR